MEDKAFEVFGESFDPEVIHGDKPVLVEFLTSQCDSCWALAAMVNTLAAEYAGKLKVVSVDLDLNPDFITLFGLIGIPALIIFKGGKPVERLLGMAPSFMLKSAIERSI